jgi:Na+-driven multidrug efflux pump
LFTFVDMAYAALLPDPKAAIAAIAFYLPLGSIYIAVWVGLSAGFTACLSKAFGLRDGARVRQLKRSLLAVLATASPSIWP